MLQESESLLTSSLSSPSSTVLITDLEGCIVYVSPNVKDVPGLY